MVFHYPKSLLTQSIATLTTTLSAAEAVSIAFLLLEKIFALTHTAIIINSPIDCCREQIKRWEDALDQLSHHYPLQYLFGEADFYGRKFFVSNHVLIPRQETELAIRILSTHYQWHYPHIIDIGTGSGCIACSLALEIPNAQVTGIDICKDALAIAKKNADLVGTQVHFLQLDILNQPLPSADLDLIVSNPPYVMERERKAMKENVLHYEPSLALFVPDHDALLFYRTIATKGWASLKKEGVIFFEINEQLAHEVVSLLNAKGYHKIKIHHDLHDKPRFVSGFRQ